MNAFALRPITRSDFPLVARWRREPHVARWWCDSPEPQAIEAEYGGVIDGREAAQVFIAHGEGRPVGLVQRFALDGYPPYRDEIAAWTPVPAGAWSLDYFLGEPSVLRRGWGTALVAQLASGIFADHPAASAILVPVHADNLASCRVLERCGFRHAGDGEFEPDHPDDDRRHRIYRLDRR